MELYGLNLLGAALLALLVMLLPALAHTQHWNVMREGWRDPLRLLFGLFTEELGVVVVTYDSKYGGVATTTPPTAVQANQLPIQAAQIYWADADTQAIFVHNWGGLLGPSFATFLFPMIQMNKMLGSGTFGATLFTFGLANSNQVYITKAAGDAGGTYNCYLFLPHSLIGGAR